VTKLAGALPRGAVGPIDLVPWLLTASSGGAAPVELDVVAVDRVTEAADGSIRLGGAGERFAAVATWTPLAELVGGWSVLLDISHRPSFDAVEATIAVAVHVAADRTPEWLIPGLFFGENRPAESTAAYPRWVPEASGNDPFAAADWWFRSDRAATPAILASGGGVRASLATTETSPLGQTGVGFGTVRTARGEQREIRLSFPYREAPVVYDGSPTPAPPDLPTHRWEPGETVRLSFRATIVEDRPEASTPILRAFHDWLAPSAPLRPWVGPAEAATLAADGLLRWHFRPNEGVLIETAAFERGGDGSGLEPGDRLAMHVAWLSGAPAAYALLAHGRRVGRDDAAAAGRRVLHAIATHLAPCGTFWAQWTAADGWGKGWTPGPDALHARTLGEAALFLARALALEPHDEWRAALTSNLAFIATSERNGGIPSAWNGRTGEPLSFAGTAPLAWVPPLVAGGRLLDDPGLLDVARRVGERFAPDVEAGRLCGAPEDVDLGPTSEDGYVAILAYVALARAAGNQPEAARWIRLARLAADWTLTFRYTYDVDFPAGSILAEHDFGTRGADLASPANQHLHAYGLICSEELLEVARLTGDDHYRERARETYACFRQFIARHEGDFEARRGMAPERFYQTRYDGPKGWIGPLSHAWCLGLLLHASEVAATRPELVAP
jgi:hypothetical protein